MAFFGQTEYKCAIKSYKILAMSKMPIQIFSKYILFLISFLALSSGFTISASEEITIKGDVVAISNDPISWVIINGFVHTEILICVIEPKDLATQIIRVRLSIPERIYNKWMSSFSNLHQFRIKRQTEHDGPLIKKMRVIDSSGKEEVIKSGWDYLSGGQKLQLSPDQQIMTFESIDWPVMPVI
jgi:hypothetical protein